MILNVSSRTDIVHYYTPWFLERLREGRAIVPNPEVPDHAMELDLSPESVQGIVFCSKDYRPLLPHLARLAGKWPVYCHYTITPYGRDVEPGVPDVRESMATLRELSRIIGRERVAWRYDPVLVNGAYPVQRHMRDFTAMAGILAPFISLCVFSFVDLYGKVRRAMPDLMPVSTRDMDTLAAWFGQTAQRLGFPIQTCGPAPDYTRFGIGHSGCITAALLGKAWGLCLGRARPGNRRRGCGCMATVDIGPTTHAGPDASTATPAAGRAGRLRQSRIRLRPCSSEAWRTIQSQSAAGTEAGSARYGSRASGRPGGRRPGQGNRGHPGPAPRTAHIPFSGNALSLPSACRNFSFRRKFRVIRSAP